MKLDYIMLFAMEAALQNRDQLAANLLRCMADFLHKATPAQDTCLDTPHASCGQVPQFATGQDGQGIDGLNSFVDDTQGGGLVYGKFSPESNTLSPSLHGNDQVAFASAVEFASHKFIENKFVDEGDSLQFDEPYVAEASSDEKPSQPRRVVIAI